MKSIPRSDMKWYPKIRPWIERIVLVKTDVDYTVVHVDVQSLQKQLVFIYLAVVAFKNIIHRY